MSAIAHLGRVLGLALYVLARRRRNIVHTNLRLCFPDLMPSERRALAREHFALAGRSLLERTHMWWSDAALLNSMNVVSGEAYLQTLYEAKIPVILLLPHFLALDMVGAVLGQRYNAVSMYAKQSNPVFDVLLLRGRTRFGQQTLISRQEGIRPVVKAVRAGTPFLYLPDLDYGTRDAIFVPFFGIPTATITGLSRLAHLTGAKVLPCLTRMTPTGYALEIGAPWENFPTQDVVADTLRMNAFIEEAIRTMPAQYYWLHRRFKHRPEGEPGFYD